MATENAQRVGGFDSKSARQQRQNWAYFPHRAGLALHAGLGVGCDLSTCGTTKALGIPVSGILKLSLFSHCWQVVSSTVPQIRSPC